MKILIWLLLLLGLVACVIAFNGHSGAWAVAAVCFFSSAMVSVAQRNKKSK